MPAATAASFVNSRGRPRYTTAMVAAKPAAPRVRHIFESRAPMPLQGARTTALQFGYLHRMCKLRKFTCRRHASHAGRVACSPTARMHPRRSSSLVRRRTRIGSVASRAISDCAVTDSGSGTTACVSARGFANKITWLALGVNAGHGSKEV